MTNKFNSFLTTLTLSLSFASSAGEKAHWSYGGSHGPSHWGTFDGAELCESGKEQSPIDLKWKKPSNSKRDIKFNYSNRNSFKVIDNGHTVQANFEKGNYVVVDNKRFELVQLHFHSHSEHSLSNKFFPLEMHLVHKSEEGKLAVVGVFFEQGSANDEIQKIWSGIPSKKNEEKKADKEISLMGLLPTQFTHYNYTGSLTTPPCSEGVNWNVLNTPMSLSAEQLSAFKKLYAENFRPVQQVFQRKPANY